MRRIGGLNQYFFWQAPITDPPIGPFISDILNQQHWSISFWWNPIGITTGFLISTKTPTPATNFISISQNSGIVFYDGGYQQAGTLNTTIPAVSPGSGWVHVHCYLCRQVNTNQFGGVGIIVTTEGGSPSSQHFAYQMGSADLHKLIDVTGAWCIGRDVNLASSNGGALGYMAGALFSYHDDLSFSNETDLYNYHLALAASLAGGLHPLRHARARKASNTRYFELEGFTSREIEPFARMSPSTITAPIASASSPILRAAKPGLQAVPALVFISPVGGISPTGTSSGVRSNVEVGGVSPSGALVVNFNKVQVGGGLSLSGLAIQRKDVLIAPSHMTPTVHLQASTIEAPYNQFLGPYSFRIVSTQGAAFSGPTIDVLVHASSTGVAVGVGLPAVIAAQNVVAIPAPISIIATVQAPGHTTDDGDGITPNPGYIFTENEVTMNMTDKEMAQAFGVRFTVIRNLRRGTPDWRVKDTIEKFAEKFKLPVWDVRGHYYSRIQKANRLGGLYKAPGDNGSSSRWGALALDRNRTTQYMGLRDKPARPVSFEIGDPFATTWIDATSDGLISCPTVSSKLDLSKIDHRPEAYFTHIEVVGGAVKVTLDGREVTPVQYDYIIGEDAVLGAGNGADGPFQIDEFSAVPDNNNALDLFEIEHFALFGFGRPSGAAPSTTARMSLRVHPEQIRIMATTGGVLYRVDYELVGPLAFAR